MSGILIDPGKCIACRACEVACEREHRKSFITVFEFESSAVPLNCRHCEKAPCIEACPTGALFRDKDGAVMVDVKKCIGCDMCLLACPFGIPEIAGKIMVKCDLCPERRAEGKLPLCVQTCPTGALSYEEPDEFSAKRRKAYAERLALRRAGNVSGL